MKNPTKKTTNLELGNAARILDISKGEIRKELGINKLVPADNHSKKGTTKSTGNKWLDPEQIDQVDNKAQLISLIVDLYSKRIKESEGTHYEDVIDEIDSITDVCLTDHELKSMILEDCNDFLLEVISKSDKTSLVYFLKPWSMEPFREAALKRWLMLVSTSDEILTLNKRLQDISSLYNASYVSAMHMKIIRKLDKTLLSEIAIIETKPDVEAKKDLAIMFKKIKEFGNELEARRRIIKKVVDLFN